MARVFLGLGSNVGDRGEFLRSAVRRITAMPSIKIVRASSVYETEPHGTIEQRDFLNAVLEAETNLEPGTLFHQLKEIETDTGRTKGDRWGPREIDIDILYFESRIVRTTMLHIPHREIAGRRFVLVPLAEIAPLFEDPERSTTVQGLLDRCKDERTVRKTEEPLTISEEFGRASA